MVAVDFEWRTKLNPDGEAVQGFMVHDNRIIATIWPTDKGYRWVVWTRSGTVETEGIDSDRETAQSNAADAAFDGTGFPGGYPMTQHDLRYVMESQCVSDTPVASLPALLDVKLDRDADAYGSWGQIKPIELGQIMPAKIDPVPYWGNALAAALRPASETQIEFPPSWEFVPTEDITAYELARSIPIVLHAFMYVIVDEDRISHLPDHCRRHWRQRKVDPGDTVQAPAEESALRNA